MSDTSPAGALPAGAISKLIVGPVTGMIRDRVSQDLAGQKDLKNIDKAKSRIKRTLGVDAGAMSFKNKYQGAFWLPPELSKNYLTHLKGKGVKLSRRERSDIKSQRGKSGLIVMGGDYVKPSVLAHEAGHAKAYESGNFVERMGTRAAIATGHGNPVTHKIPSSIAAVALGRRYGMLAGILGGGAAGAITESPTLISEGAANRYARNFLTKRQNEDTKGVYLPQWLNYAASATLPFAMIGGITGGGPKLLKLIDAAKRRLS